jgi:hypothetical protein
VADYAGALRGRRFPTLRSLSAPFAQIARGIFEYSMRPPEIQNSGKIRHGGSYGRGVSDLTKPPPHGVTGLPEKRREIARRIEYRDRSPVQARCSIGRSRKRQSQIFDYRDAPKSASPVNPVMEKLNKSRTLTDWFSRRTESQYCLALAAVLSAGTAVWVATLIW